MNVLTLTRETAALDTCTHCVPIFKRWVKLGLPRWTSVVDQIKARQFSVFLVSDDLTLTINNPQRKVTETRQTVTER